jgi:hypothetical protein
MPIYRLYEALNFASLQEKVPNNSKSYCKIPIRIVRCGIKIITCPGRIEVFCF